MDMITDAKRVAEHEAARQAVAKAAGGEVLTFRLGEEEYGIDILRVQEIRSYEPPTRIANAPAHITGVVNLRGVIVPIVDLRLRLGCASAEFTPFTVVVVLNLSNRVVGAIVDAVSDVLDLPAGCVQPAPQMASTVQAEFITGIATHKTDAGSRMLILIDIEALVADAGV